MVPSIQNNSITLPNHQPAQVAPVITPARCAKSTLSQGAKGDGLVMSILKPIGRFFSWLWSSIMGAFTCCKKTTFTKSLEEVKEDLQKRREDFDERDSIQIICGWGFATGHSASQVKGARFQDDLKAEGIDYATFQQLYTLGLISEGSELRESVGIHEEISDYLDLKVKEEIIIAKVEARIKEIGDAKLTKPLSDVLVRVRSEGLTEEVEAAVRAAEKKVCLNQFRQYVQTAS